MLAAAHRQAAEDIEATLQRLAGDERAGRMVIEGTWGAAFHWIAFGCATKHGQHRETHIRLGAFLRSQGEPVIAVHWDDLERVRQGGWYGSHVDADDVRRALDLLREVATWAQT